MTYSIDGWPPAKQGRGQESVAMEKRALNWAKACCYSVESQQLTPNPEVRKSLSPGAKGILNNCILWGS